jgi:hypothetical protein
MRASAFLLLFLAGCGARPEKLERVTSAIDAQELADLHAAAPADTSARYVGRPIRVRLRVDQVVREGGRLTIKQKLRNDRWAVGSVAASDEPKVRVGRTVVTRGEFEGFASGDELIGRCEVE